MRSTRWWSAGSVQNVSCMVRAGWSGPRLSASKLSHSASTTGPSATSQPIATKTSAISSEPVVSGCRAPRGGAVGRQRDVDGLLDQHPLLVLGLEHLLPRGERLVDRAAGLADPLPGLLAGLRRQRADLAVGQRERRPVAGVLEPDLLELGEVAGRGDRRERGVAHRLDLLGLERRDLDGVVIGVRSGHGGLSRTDGSGRDESGGKSRNRPTRRRERVPRVGQRLRPGRRSSAGQVSSIRAPPPAASPIVDRAAVGADQAVDEVHAEAGAAARAACPELGEHPAPHLRRDALALVLDDEPDAGVLGVRPELLGA